MTKSAKKSTIISAICAIIMCISLVVGATFALFTSESPVNIAVTSGKVKVVATIAEDSLKTYSGENLTGVVEDDVDRIKLTTALGGENGKFINGGTAELDGDTLTLDKMTPGDKVTFQIVVYNYSNVKVKYRTKIVESDDDGLYAGLKFDIGGFAVKSSTVWKDLAPASDDDAEIARYDCSVELPSNAVNDYQEKKCTISYIVEAIQGNAAVTVDSVEAEAIGNLTVEQTAEGEKATVKEAQTLSDSTMSVVYPAGTVLNTTDVSTGDDGVQKTSASQKLDYVSESASDALESKGIQIASTQAVAQYNLTLPVDENNITLITVAINYTAGLTGVKIYHNGVGLPSSSESGEYAEYDSDTGVITLHLKHASPIDIVYYKANASIGETLGNIWDLQTDPSIYDEATQTLTIPEGVKTIKGSYNLYSNKQKLSVKKLVLPDSLETIGNEVFYGGDIAEIVWPENSKIKSIGNGAFNFCRSLTEVNLPASVEKMGLGVFANCQSLTKVSGLPEQYIKNVPQSMFGSCPLVVADNPWLMKMETIGLGAFGGSFAQGETLDLSSAPLTSIDKGAFSGSNLAEVVLPNTLTSVGEDAFRGCSSLKKVTLPAADTNYGTAVFRASAVEEVIIPEGCVTIGQQMFYSCTNLTKISFPASLKTIGTDAFRGAKALSGNVFIPANVEVVGANAFRDLEVRCEAIEKPADWHDDWTNKKTTVTWKATE